MTEIAKNDPNYIGWLLTCSPNRDRAVMKAIIAIYNRQTEDEKKAEDTKHHNGVGFSSADARLGTYYARHLLGGKALTGKHLERARTMAMKYRGQLVDIATETLERKAIQS